MNEIVYDDDELRFGIQTTRDMNSPETKIDNRHPVYMLSDLKNKFCIFTPPKAIIFLSGIDCTNLMIKSKGNQNKKFS